LKDKTDSVRDAAAWALGEFGVAAKDAVPELIPGVTTDDATRNRYAPRALARIAPNDEEVVATLSRGLENNDLRDSIIDAIQELGPNAAAYLPALKKVIPVTDKSSLYDVFRIVEALGPAGKPALPEMIAFLSGPDRDLREYSLQAIGAMKDQAADAIPEIVKCVSDKNEDVARKAVNTLVRIGEPAKAAIPDLEAAVAATESKDLKDLLQIAIGRLSSPLTGLDAEVNDFLDSDRDWTVLQQKFPNETLASLIQSIIRLRGNPDRTVSQRASSMLTYAQHVPAAREELVKRLSSEDVSQQAIAAMILARMPSTGDKLELARQLQTMIEADEQSHYVGVSLILQCGRPAIPIVASLLTSGATKSSHRESLLRSVAYTNNYYLPPLLEQLREAMKSDNVSTRQSAIVALAVLNPREPELLPRVLECLESDEPSFKTMAAGALTEMSRCGVDVKVAIPKLVAMLTQATANSGERDDGRARTFGAAAAVLKEVGIRKEDAPAVRSILQAALEAEGDGDKYRYSEIAQNGNTAIHLLSSLGPDAAEVLPDVKRFILRTQQVYDADVLANFGEPAIQMLIELTHPDQQSPVRTAALQALVDTRGDFRETIDPRLIELMKDADLAVRARAAIAQGKTNDPAVVAVLVESLQGADDQLQSVLLPHLGGLGEAAAPAVPRLLELVNHPDSRAWTRFQQMQTLLRIAPRNPEVDAALLSYLKQEKDYIHITSHEERLIPLLIQWVGEQPAPVAQRAAVMLQDFDEKAKDAVPALQKLMNAAEAGEASVDAAMALAHIDPATPDVAPRLIAAFDQRYRDYAYLEALRRLGPASSELLPKVIARIEAGDENLYGVLGAMGLAAKPTVPKLMAVLNDSNNYYGALEALRMLSSVAPEIGEQIQADLQNEERRLAAILKLNILGPRAEFALPMLIDLSQGTDLQWRTASLQALRGIEGHDAEIVPLLAAALSDPDPRVVSAAASALAAHAKGAESALPQLIAALEAPDKAPKWMLINVASEMGTAAKDTVPVLEKMSKASDRHLRASAKRAIDKIQGRTANDE
jgi:HEAT repeat protein